MSDDRNKDDDDFLKNLPSDEDDPFRPIDTDMSNPRPGAQESKSKAPLDQSMSTDILIDTRLEQDEKERKRLLELKQERHQLETNPEMARAQQKHHAEIRYLKKGEVYDLMSKIPSLKRIQIGAGWDQRAIEDGTTDIDMSLFLLNKNDMTRVDEDFVFYNNMSDGDNAVVHEGDNRTGAGEGDDEVATVDLNGLSYDIVKIAIVLSVYDPDYEGLNFHQVKNTYVRIANADDGDEICRYKFPDEELDNGTAVLAAFIEREGVKWTVRAGEASPIEGGLGTYATKYGIIVKEMQSTAIGDLDSQMATKEQDVTDEQPPSETEE